MAAEVEDSGPGIPEWVVTFGDMMSLLLTFFIMLVSMSEVKQEEQFQALVESMRRRFGHDMTINSISPGNSTPRNSDLKNLALMGRSKRAHTMEGGDKVRAPVGEHPRVRTIRPGDQQTTGGVIYFAEGTSDLSEENKRQLQIAAEELGGKPQRIEIRGHTSRKPVDKDSPYRDSWDLAYARCHKTMEFLIQIGINPRRLRLGVAADNEPRYLGIDAQQRQRNARVEVLMLDEQAEDLYGSEAAADP